MSGNHNIACDIARSISIICTIIGGRGRGALHLYGFVSNFQVIHLPAYDSSACTHQGHPVTRLHLSLQNQASTLEKRKVPEHPGWSISSRPPQAMLSTNVQLLSQPIAYELVQGALVRTMHVIQAVTMKERSESRICQCFAEHDVGPAQASGRCICRNGVGSAG